eukprot:m.31008 g.31008  ORF g.31008 m.31008 type:complete len:306 (-) comp5291_c0_seq1:1957-2874(-)
MRAARQVKGGRRKCTLAGAREETIVIVEESHTQELLRPLLVRDAVLFKLLENRIVEIGGGWAQNTGAATLREKVLSGNGHGEADGEGHGRVALGVAAADECRVEDFLLAVAVLDAKLVGEQDHVGFVGIVGKNFGEQGGNSVEHGALARNNHAAKETQLVHSAQDSLGVGSRLLVGKGLLDALDGIRVASEALDAVVPGHLRVTRFEVVALLEGKEAEVLEALHDVAEALVAEGTAQNGVGFWNAVNVSVDHRVAVRVALEAKARVELDVACVLEELAALNLLEFTALLELGSVETSRQERACAP